MSFWFFEGGFVFGCFRTLDLNDFSRAILDLVLSGLLDLNGFQKDLVLLVVSRTLDLVWFFKEKRKLIDIGFGISLGIGRQGFFCWILDRLINQSTSDVKVYPQCLVHKSKTAQLKFISIY